MVREGLIRTWCLLSRLMPRIGPPGEGDMGDIGTERRVVEFEPLPDEPVAEPNRKQEPAPAAPTAPVPAQP